MRARYAAPQVIREVPKMVSVPVEVIREVPVEIIREVEKIVYRDVIKEVRDSSLPTSRLILPSRPRRSGLTACAAARPTRSAAWVRQYARALRAHASYAASRPSSAAPCAL